MAIKLPNGDILRNLEEQVRKNKEDIQHHYEIERVIADWGIRIIGQLETWEVPTGSFEYGDAYAVGPDGGPFVFYIYTRGNPDYWFDYGAISIVGPAGPQGPAGVGERGERGSKWYIGPNAPSGPDIKANDIWLRISNDGRTDGFVYIYQNNTWALATSIIGPQGIQGETGPAGPRGPQGPQGIQGPRGYTTITRIIGSLPEGSIIADTYNPAEQPENATVLMPVNGENHAWVIIDGVWTDAGPYSGGSAVYANGEYQQTFDADTKLDKNTGVTGYNQVYVKGTNGSQLMVNMDSNPIANAMPRYTSQATLRTGIPINNMDCATKAYVDGSIAEAHSEAHHSMNLAFAKASGYAPMEYTIPLSFLYNQFKNLTVSPSMSEPRGTITIPCEFYYSVYGNWTLAFPFAWLDFYILEIYNNQIHFGIKLSEAGTGAGYVECEGTLDDQTQSITFTGYIIEAPTGAPLSEARIILILPPDISLPNQ